MKSFSWSYVVAVACAFTQPVFAGIGGGQGLYSVGADPDTSSPIKYFAGVDLTADDNVTPTYSQSSQSSVSVSPYFGAAFTAADVRTVMDFYGRVGLRHYLDEVKGLSNDTTPSATVGFNLSHAINERLRFTSKNFLSYEYEPNYNYGFATSRQSDPYFYWQTDNALGYRWNERLATYTGFTLSGISYQDQDNLGRFTYALYNQFRYQLGARDVATFDYRYARTLSDGIASDSTDQYFLLGLEHRFSSNTIGIVKAGIQYRNVDNGLDSTNPFFEGVIDSRVSEKLRLRAFARYSIESYDTVQSLLSGVATAGNYEFDERETLRLGITGEYVFNETFSFYSTLDYIPTSYKGARLVNSSVEEQISGDDSIYNISCGVTARIRQNLYATLSYSHTDSTSDFSFDYKRNIYGLGIRAEF